MLSCLQIFQESAPTGIPAWLTHGPLPVFLIVLVVLVLLYLWVNYRLKRVQRQLHELGESYFEKERVILNDYKSGRITHSEYRKKHIELVDGMRSDSRKITDGPT